MYDPYIYIYNKKQYISREVLCIKYLYCENTQHMYSM